MNTNKLIKHIRDKYSTKDFIPLHAPTFNGNEIKYVSNTINSTFVSSIGEYVDLFEKEIEYYTNSPIAVSTVNGTAALHASLYMSGVKHGDLVITQALTFVATCNAIFHIGAEPILIDVSSKSLGLCPTSLNKWLNENVKLINGRSVLKKTKQKIKAVVVMHTFGHPAEIDEIKEVCRKWNLILIEDAAESFGSFYKEKHTGTFGKFGTLSFNGNKIITTGGGGAILCNNIEMGKEVKHVTTTAKVPHDYEFYHDKPGFNYRMPNINAALGCGQIQSINPYLKAKRYVANCYEEFFKNSDYIFVKEPDYAKSNYWLNSVICPDKKSRDILLNETNKKGIMTRPVWKLMHKLPMYSKAICGDLKNSEYYEDRLVNLPSSPIKKIKK